MHSKILYKKLEIENRKHFLKLNGPLRLSNNRLEGEMYSMLIGLVKLPNFVILSLAGNRFEGEIQDFPPTKHSINLLLLDIKNNSISGKLPRWISTYFSKMMVLDMSNNSFDGPIPEEFCQFHQLQYLDISTNNLSGSIPSCFKYLYATLVHVHLGHNQLEGSITNAFNGSSTLRTLDLLGNHLSGRISAKISSFSALDVLLLKGNNFEGEIPVQLCQMKSLSLIDLSHNNFSGHLPNCLNSLASGERLKAYFGVNVAYGMSFDDLNIEADTLSNKYLDEMWNIYTDWITDQMEELVEFSTKRNSHIYKGKILNMMLGLDLSSNHFSGQIPLEFGNLSEIHALNLSYNSFTGFIPSSFSNLRQIESLDLSHNHLSGEIPPQLVELTTLEVFSMAFNNLSGQIPDQKGQFGTFDMTSYEGNPLLCGPAINISCNKMKPTSKTAINEDEEDEDNFFDINFYVSFLVAYAMTVLVGVIVLLINPYWRQVWFHYVEVLITSVQDFVLDSMLWLHIGT